MPDNVYLRALADLPASDQVAAEAAAYAATRGVPEADLIYLASRYHGLYLRARGLLEALAKDASTEADTIS